MHNYLIGYEAYLQNISLAKHTIKQYVLDATHFLQFCGDEVHVEKELAAYRQHLLSKYTQAQSINRKLAGTRKFILFLYDRQYIKTFNESVFEPVKLKQHESAALNEQQLQQLQNELQQLISKAQDVDHLFLAHRHLAMVTTFLTTGIKPSQLVAMKWQHIEADKLFVPSMQLQLPIDSDLQRALVHYKATIEKLFPVSEYVWLGLGNKQGEPITEKTVERAFQYISQFLTFKITATLCRYTFLQQASDELTIEQLGFSRKDSLKLRKNRIK